MAVAAREDLVATWGPNLASSLVVLTPKPETKKKKKKNTQTVTSIHKFDKQKQKHQKAEKVDERV